jgi:hypothetical protein
MTLLTDLEKNNTLEEPGQFEIIAVAIQTKVGDVILTEIIESFNLYESIFNTFVTGDITIIDRKNFVNQANITGTEPVYIKFRTKGSKYNVNVRLAVSKIKNKEKINETSSRYTFSLVSPDFFTDMRTKISKSFEGTYSDIVKNIYTDYLSSGVPLWLEETDNNNRVIIPNKSPVDSINMLSQFSRTSLSANANFLFFQTTKSFHYRSISDMVDLDDSKITIRVEKEQAQKDVIIARKATRAFEFEVKSDADVLRHTSLGTYGSTLIKHNIRSKDWGVSIWNYHDAYLGDTEADYIFVNDYPMSPTGPVDIDGGNLSAFPNSSITMISSAEEYSYQTLQDIPDFERLDYENTLLARSAEMFSVNLQRAKLKIGGMSGIQAGDVIRMNVPKPDVKGTLKGGKSERDDKVSGKWLVESVSHQVKDKYYCIIMLIRDAIPEPQTSYTAIKYPEQTPKIVSNNR